MSLTLTGTVYHIGDVEVKSERFRKQEIVLMQVEKNGDREFKNYPKFEFANGNIDKLTGLSKGDVVTISYNIKGNRYEHNGIEKFSLALQGWKVEKQAEDHYQDDIF